MGEVLNLKTNVQGTLVWLNNIENMQIIIQLYEMCMYNHLTASRTNKLHGLNLFNPKAFLSVVDWRISTYFEPCLDLTLTYNILSGHTSVTIKIWIAATDYYMYFYIIVIFPLTANLQLINFTTSYFLVY